MDPLEHTLDLATRMREALEAEFVRAREQRVLVRKLDVQGLFERARHRGELNLKVGQLRDALTEALGKAARVVGVERVTGDLLNASGIPSAQRPAKALSELRASAQALQEID